MAMIAKHRSKFAALHQQWWRLHMSEKFLSGTKNPKQTIIIISLQTEVNNIESHTLQYLISNLTEIGYVFLISENFINDGMYNNFWS